MGKQSTFVAVFNETCSQYTIQKNRMKIESFKKEENQIFNPDKLKVERRCRAKHIQMLLPKLVSKNYGTL